MWKKHNWYNHGDTKSLWYNSLQENSITKNKGELSENNFNYDFDVDLSDFDRFPIADNKLKIIYTSHMIEHLPNESVKKVFKESYRMLKEEGVFRVVCPNVDILFDNLVENNNVDFINNYINKFGFHGYNNDDLSNIDKFLYCQFSYFCKYYTIKDIHLIKDKEVYNKFLSIDKIDDNKFKNLLENFNTKYDLFDYLRENSELLYPEFKYQLTGLHTNWWNSDKVIKFLEEAGFKKIIIQSRNKSVSEEFNSDYFDSTIPELSLFIDAIK